ncbi:MAG: hypothetical protein RSF75_05275, partial [Acidaminococcaceae bacterium]
GERKMAKNKTKALITSVLCGISTFSVMPTTDYSHYVPRNANVITRAAWQRTGGSLKASINKVGMRIGASETTEQIQ